MIPCYTRLLFLASKLIRRKQLNHEKPFLKNLLFIVSWLCLIHHINGNSIEQTKQLNKRVKRFTCPGDGKWPDEKDCER